MSSTKRQGALGSRNTPEKVPRYEKVPADAALILLTETARGTSLGEGHQAIHANLPTGDRQSIGLERLYQSIPH
jgi:hypothetical protein